jgi:hypothetical protein
MIVRSRIETCEQQIPSEIEARRSKIESVIGSPTMEAQVLNALLDPNQELVL